MDKPITLREELRIAVRIASIRLRGQMAYRASFWMQIAGNLLTHLMEIVALFAMFYQFDTLGGWTLGEVALLHGISMIVFSVADTLTVGMDSVAHQIRSGDVDDRQSRTGAVGIHCWRCIVHGTLHRRGDL